MEEPLSPLLSAVEEEPVIPAGALVAAKSPEAINAANTFS